VRKLLAVGVLAAAAVGPGQPASGAAGGSCIQPYLPWHSAIGLYPPDPQPQFSTSTDLTYRAPTFDMDGDGTVDTIGNEEPTPSDVVVHRGDGDLVLTLPGSNLVGVGMGDLDGDGRTELLIAVGSASDQWVIPGTTAPGTFDP
jgi:hypothetical protein